MTDSLSSKLARSSDDALIRATEETTPKADGVEGKSNDEIAEMAQRHNETVCGGGGQDDDNGMSAPSSSASPPRKRARGNDGDDGKNLDQEAKVDLCPPENPPPLDSKALPSSQEIVDTLAQFAKNVSNVQSAGRSSLGKLHEASEKCKAALEKCQGALKDADKKINDAFPDSPTLDSLTAEKEQAEVAAKDAGLQLLRRIRGENAEFFLSEDGADILTRFGRVYEKAADFQLPSPLALDSAYAYSSDIHKREKIALTFCQTGMRLPLDRFATQAHSIHQEMADLDEKESQLHTFQQLTGEREKFVKEIGELEEELQSYKETGERVKQIVDDFVAGSTLRSDKLQKKKDALEALEALTRDDSSGDEAEGASD